MPTDAREFIAIGESVFADDCVIERDRFGGVSVLLWGGIIGDNKTRLIAINGNINSLIYINDVLAVFLHSKNIIYVSSMVQMSPHSAAITSFWRQIMSMF